MQVRMKTHQTVQTNIITFSHYENVLSLSSRVGHCSLFHPFFNQIYLFTVFWVIQCLFSPQADTWSNFWQSVLFRSLMSVFSIQFSVYFLICLVSLNISSPPLMLFHLLSSMYIHIHELGIHFSSLNLSSCDFYSMSTFHTIQNYRNCLHSIKYHFSFSSNFLATYPFYCYVYVLKFLNLIKNVLVI